MSLQRSHYLNSLIRCTASATARSRWGRRKRAADGADTSNRFLQACLRSIASCKHGQVYGMRKPLTEPWGGGTILEGRCKPSDQSDRHRYIGHSFNHVFRVLELLPKIYDTIALHRVCTILAEPRRSGQAPETDDSDRAFTIWYIGAWRIFCCLPNARRERGCSRKRSTPGSCYVSCCCCTR